MVTEKCLYFCVPPGQTITRTTSGSVPLDTHRLADGVLMVDIGPHPYSVFNRECVFCFSTDNNGFLVVYDPGRHLFTESWEFVPFKGYYLKDMGETPLPTEHDLRFVLRLLESEREGSPRPPHRQSKWIWDALNGDGVLGSVRVYRMWLASVGRHLDELLTPENLPLVRAIMGGQLSISNLPPCWSREEFLRHFVRLSALVQNQFEMPEGVPEVLAAATDSIGVVNSGKRLTESAGRCVSRTLKRKADEVMSPSGRAKARKVSSTLTGAGRGVFSFLHQNAVDGFNLVYDLASEDAPPALH